MSDRDEKLLDHNYDGIQEYDNPLPRWWLLTFYGTIVFGVFYVGYYHAGSGPSPEAVLAQDLSELKTLEVKANGPGTGPTEESLAAVLKDNDRREGGKRVFVEKCAACHGPDGGGLIGPNLTDSHWIHGKGSLVDISQVVSEGVLDKGMPPWKTLLKKEEVENVTAYVRTLRGTHPANPKAPQGELVKD